MILPINRKVTYMMIASIKNEFHVKEKSRNSMKKNSLINITDSPAIVILINILRIPMPCPLTIAYKRKTLATHILAIPICIILS